MDWNLIGLDSPYFTEVTDNPTYCSMRLTHNRAKCLCGMWGWIHQGDLDCPSCRAGIPHDVPRGEAADD